MKDILLMHILIFFLWVNDISFKYRAMNERISLRFPLVQMFKTLFSRNVNVEDLFTINL